MTFSFSVPGPDAVHNFDLDSGSALIFVGANGGGKTRLAVHIENSLNLRAHRISAHRALNLNPDVPKISETKALLGLRTGYAEEGAQVQHRQGNRWGNKQAIFILNDFDYLIQALFAEQANTSLKAYHQYKPGSTAPQTAFQLTKFDQLREIWGRLLPHRILHTTGDNILVSLPNSQKQYKASEMSDGERAIFYMIGQVLVAEENQVLIIDEPELHVHRSIMSKLWDELEAKRPDCAFLFITHDLEFAAARNAQKFVIRDYNPTPHWTIDQVPEETGFDEDIATMILGSRRPILFVEGSRNSLDLPLYRCCYPEWTVIPRSSCAEVIHAVTTLRANAELTRVTCSGIVDGDHYSAEDVSYLNSLGIAVLPVCEIENIVLLPSVSRAIAEAEGFEGEELETRITLMSAQIVQRFQSGEKIEEIVTRYVRREIDRRIKKMDLSAARTIQDVQDEFTQRTLSLDIEKMAEAFRADLKQALTTADISKILLLCDDKGLLAIPASVLKACHVKAFCNWFTRILRNNTAPGVANAVTAQLPKLKPL